MEDLIETNQNYTVKGQYWIICTWFTWSEGVKDDTKATQINLDRSKAFDKVDYQFLAAVQETTRF